MTTTLYDGVGVLLLPCRRGKCKAQRIALKDGAIVVLSEITTGRHMMAAHKCAAQDFMLLATDLARGQLELSQPEQLTLNFE